MKQRNVCTILGLLCLIGSLLAAGLAVAHGSDGAEEMGRWGDAETRGGGDADPQSAIRHPQSAPTPPAVPVKLIFIHHSTGGSL